jgi:hypothetical protein
VKRVLLAIALVLMIPVIGFAQESPEVAQLRKDVESLKSSHDALSAKLSAMGDDIAAIKQLLQDRSQEPVVVAQPQVIREVRVVRVRSVRKSGSCK